ncbi:predicted sugar phosphatases of the HAD superfamily [Longilinea arvoryzae]|uniref:Predicted sugar phosphatases of the HAD superfamily n=1 Tax=Longilinea arvoryzae TaxID=360412 RepID=A0A0S7BK29_9CHLR|nr:HAD-IIA family hydrolase [Longilinea arvoryzae]GAP14854.1 predicted sugar phosphatases of the HAD superfamily [Longilinea arvoryzae]
MQFSLPIQAMILDMDGVLWKGQETIGDLPSIFSRLQAKGIQVILATNNATRTPEQYTERLAGYGVTIETWRVINSAKATAFRMKRDFPEGGPVYVIGEEGLVDALAAQGFCAASFEDHPIAVVAAMDRQLTYAKLRWATLLIRKGIPFYGTNPDRTFPTPDGLIPGAGSILAALEAATSVHPIIAGKPSPDMYYMALDLLKVDASHTLAVGDRLDTDILGGQRAACRTGLVLSGVTSLEDVQTWEPRPDYVAGDLSQLVDMI